MRIFVITNEDREIVAAAETFDMAKTAAEEYASDWDCLPSEPRKVDGTILNPTPFWRVSCYPNEEETGSCVFDLIIEEIPFYREFSIAKHEAISHYLRQAE